MSAFKNDRSKTTPLRRDVKFEDIEAIDLTGEPERFLPPSAAEFIEPRRLWDEAVSRETPKEKRGKKRKSEEYTSDLISPSKHATKIRNPSKADRSPSTKDVVTEPPPNNPKPATSTPHRNQKNVIADSDEEDPFDSWLEADDIDDMVLDDTGLYPKLPEMSPTESKKQTREKTPPKKPPRKVPARETSTELNMAIKPAQRHQPPPELKIPSSQPKDTTILNFLALSTKSLDNSILQLKSTLKMNSESVYEQAMQGRQAPDLIAENKNLVSRIEAIETLQTQKASYDS